MCVRSHFPFYAKGASFSPIIFSHTAFLSLSLPFPLSLLKKYHSLFSNGKAEKNTLIWGRKNILNKQIYLLKSFL